LSSGLYPKFYKILRPACEELKIPLRKKHRRRPDPSHRAPHRHDQAGRGRVGLWLDYDTIGMITDHKAKELIAH